MDHQDVCAVCRTIGKRGAKWLLQVAGDADLKVHKPCGERAVASAPEGVKATLAPSPELREQWRRERAERETRAFWTEKFAQARERRKPIALGAIPPQAAE